MSTKSRFAVAADENGLRLDQVIPRHIDGLSRRKARAVIDIGGVFVDKTRVKVAGRLVRAGQQIEVNIGGAIERVNETPLAPRIVHVDDHIIIADKPAGLVTAPTPEASRGDLLDQLARTYGEVHLVHRIDLPTSGLLVFARTSEANKRLGDAFKMHDVDREYRAVVVGRIAAQTIDEPIDRRRAVTHIVPLEELANATLLSVTLETGRTHQIRIHLAAHGHPVLGDRTHGGDLERAFLPRPPRLALHAAVLGFTHPATGTRVRWEAPVPDELAGWIARLRVDSSAMTTTPTETTIDDVLGFWFGDGTSTAAQRWYVKAPAFDAEIRSRFGDLHTRAAAGELATWTNTARGSLALVVVLDQFSRNMFRDDPRSFATDPMALAITQAMLANGQFAELPPLQRFIALMPLEHSEDIAMQRECVAQFAALVAAHPGDAMLEMGLDYATKHAAIVERFGKFPHRDTILGRPSTPDELAFLQTPGSSFELATGTRTSTP